LCVCNTFVDLQSCIKREGSYSFSDMNSNQGAIAKQTTVRIQRYNSVRVHELVPIFAKLTHFFFCFDLSFSGCTMNRKGATSWLQLRSRLRLLRRFCSGTSGRNVDHPLSLKFRQGVDERLNQSARSVLVQVRSVDSCDSLVALVEQYGPVLNAFHVVSGTLEKQVLKKCRLFELSGDFNPFTVS
jgi:hypothetical protein